MSTARDRGILPRLIVSDPAAASAFYRDALDATQTFEAPPIDDGRPGVIEHRIGDATLRVSPSVESWGWLSPDDLGGSAVLLEVEVDHPDALGQRMVDAGADVLVAIADQPYGQRSGRIRDPFGHLWIVSGRPRTDGASADAP